MLGNRSNKISLTAATVCSPNYTWGAWRHA